MQSCTLGVTILKVDSNLDVAYMLMKSMGFYGRKDELIKGVRNGSKKWV